MPDIEKRLEAFVRLAHGIVVFPGGAGTAEEILYLLGILLDPANRDQPLPVVLTGPPKARRISSSCPHSSAARSASRRSKRLHDHRQRSGGRGAPPGARAWHAVREFRKARSDSYNFNWLLSVPQEFQQPFEVTHESMRALDLSRDQPMHMLAANLRRAFSGIVTGNVKEYGIQAIEKLRALRAVRRSARSWRCSMSCCRAFVAQLRMKLPGAVYKPCYRLVA